MDDCEPASFLGLPTELLLIVFEHCDTRGLAALSGVAKQYNNICRPIIFRQVDLSSHNRGKVLCTFPTAYEFLHTSWDEPSDSLMCNDIPPNIHKRQEAFLSALIRNPSLAQHVETLSWTLLLLDSNRRTHSQIDRFAINQSVVLHPKSPFNKIWNVFASLVSVRKLDLAWLSRHHAMPLIHSIPRVLFPAATSVRLVGVMPYALAASILLTKPQKLLHLDLDNLQQSGIIPSIPIDRVSETDDRYPETSHSNAETNCKILTISHILVLLLESNHRDAYLDDTDAVVDLLDELFEKVRRIEKRPARPTSTRVHIPTLIPPHRQTRQSWNNIAPFGSESEYFNASGSMQNLLGALAGKCTSLRSLYLRKAGPRDQFDFRPACRSKEDDIYAEWAIFLASVKPTLECLIFEQGERLLPRADWVQPAVRPMDQLFGDAIFPTLARRGQWPRMKKMAVRGVQEWKVDDGRGTGGSVLMDGREELKGAFGDGVEVVVRRRAREADHLGMGYV